MIGSSIKENFQKNSAWIATNVFNKNFSVVRAKSPELLKACYALRYQIFCVERKFDLPYEIIDGVGYEHDENDMRSESFLIQHRASGNYIGTGRLIMPNLAYTKEALPIQEYLSDNIIKAFALDQQEMLRSTCEISRLGILRDYGNANSDRYKKTSGFYSTLYKVHLADICKLGLYRAIFDIALNDCNTPNCVFTTDPFILRRFKKAGFTYQVMGNNIDIFGPVTPVYFNIPQMLNSAANSNRVCWSIVTDNGRIKRASAPIAYRATL